MLVKQLVKFSILILISCSATTPQKLSSFPLLDNRGILHEYRDNFDKLIFPRHNKKLTQYCATHFQWESIKAVYKRKDDCYYRWHYIVSRSKKQ